MGGITQKGEYKMDCRFNKKNLIKRIRDIAAHKGNIHLYNLDALELVKMFQKGKVDDDTIFYFDPPYYLKGPLLYMNHYEVSDHKEVSEEIKKIQNAKWIVSYDNTPKIKKLYKGIENIEYSLYHTAYKAREGKEILFFSDSLIIPKVMDPLKI
jgi:DNA adenine methylase